MAAPMALRRDLCSLARIFSGISHLGPRALGACSAHRTCNPIRSHVPVTSFHTATVFSSTPSSIAVTEEPDSLFQKVSLLVKGHDRAVLDSYEFFATMAAKELGVTINKVYEPSKDTERLTLLKSVHIFKKHRVQYEMRTHYRCIEKILDFLKGGGDSGGCLLSKKLKSSDYLLTIRYLSYCLSHLTGCTAQVYLEYVQRNLPEGVAMEVTKTAMEKVPDHIHEPMWKDHPVDDKPSQ